LLDTTIEAQLSEITQLFLGQPLRQLALKNLAMTIAVRHNATPGFGEQAQARIGERALRVARFSTRTR
jgi:hypothetical protein